MEFLYLKAKKKMYVRFYCSVVHLIFDSDFFKKSLLSRGKFHALVKHLTWNRIEV